MNKENIFNWLHRYKRRIILAAVITVVLMSAFFMGDKYDGTEAVHSSGSTAVNGEAELCQKDKEFSSILNKDNSVNNNQNNKDDISLTEGSGSNKTDSEGSTNDNQSVGFEQQSVNTDVSQKDIYSSEQVSDVEDNPSAQPPREYPQSSAQQQTVKQHEGQQQPSEPNKTEKPNEQQPLQNGNEQSDQNNNSEKLTCTFSVSCAAILNNMDKLDKDKKGLVPDDGWILAPVTVEIKHGETVFDVLKRICMSKKIHMESSWTPMYNNAYIEGINNLYQFDCGSLSGWVYCINGTVYNYGCSSSVIENGDVVEWVYTCDLGKDVQK